MKMMSILAASVAALAMAAPAAAAPVIFTYEGNFSGTVAGEAFSDFGTFTGYSDTDDFGTVFSFLTAPFSALYLMLGGISYEVTTPSLALVGLVDDDLFATGVIFDPLEDGFSNTVGGTFSLSMVGPNYPIPLDDPFVSAGFQTDLGAITITDGSNLTFSFAVVPEPATWAMMVAGFGLVGAGLRRRQTVSARINFA